MGVPGRKPKPTNLKVIEGNPGKRPLNKGEPKPAPIKPSCPSWLSRVAKTEWKRLSKELEALGLLTQIDRGVFAQYCQAYANWRAAEEHMKTASEKTNLGPVFMTPKGHLQAIPQVGISHKSQLIMLRCAAELGLTPSARGRISVNPGGDDDLDDILD